MDWFTVFEFVRQITTGPALPHPGTTAWQALCDDDKKRAVLRAGVLWALGEDARQDAMCNAAQAIRDSADWSAVARRHVQRQGVYIPRRPS